MSVRTEVIACAVALGFVLASGSARAECGADEAEKLYTQARSAFERQEYDRSIELLQNAYRCDPNRIYLANIARAYEEANRPKEALEAWRVYLATLTDAQEKKTTEGRISVLTKLIDKLDRLERDKRAAETRAESRPAQPKNEPPPKRARHVSTGAFIVTGAAAATLVTGIVLASIGRSRHNAAVDEPEVERSHDLQGSAKSYTRAANYSFGGAALLAVVGGVWIGFDLSGSSSPSVGFFRR